jgi:serine/threonine-protein kinase HipA
MPREQAVGVWLHDEYMGDISSRPGRSIRFRYSESALETRNLNTPALSCSLPTGRFPLDGRAFFAGLLPEGDARRKLAADAGVLATDVLGLLRRYGQDVAGAVTIAEDVDSRPDTAIILYDSASLEDDVSALTSGSAPLALHDDSELSIAGLQDKMLLVATPHGWARPVHGYPSTHILKLDDRAHPGLIMAEHAALEIARAGGLPAARSHIDRIADMDVLIVARFDRTTPDSGKPRRIHQEDACQALGIDLERHPRAKYQEHGGPSLRNVAELLTAWAVDDSVYRLLDQVVFTAAIGNADAHGKNVSLLHPSSQTVELAPLYDTVPTALWPSLRPRAAMSIGAAIDVTTVDFADITYEATRWGLADSAARARIAETLDRLHEATGRVEIPDHARAHQTLEHVRATTARLLRQLSAP